MENQKQYFNPNGLSNDTIDQIEKFQEGIEELRNHVSLDVIMEYVQFNKRREGVSPEDYARMDELKECEKQAILAELPVITRQAARSGIELPRIIQKVQETGELEKVPIILSFSQKVLEKIPNLKVFLGFAWLSEKELQEAEQRLSPNDNQRNREDDDKEM